MKFMLMMNAPRGTGDYGVADWKPEALKAHIRFMKDFATELKQEGAWVATEGLAPPSQARIVRAGKDGYSVFSIMAAILGAASSSVVFQTPCGNAAGSWAQCVVCSGLPARSCSAVARSSWSSTRTRR